jgi:hypothetical protein
MIGHDLNLPFLTARFPLVTKLYLVTGLSSKLRFVLIKKTRQIAVQIAQREAQLQEQLRYQVQLGNEDLA